jgi:hypothetical protein
VAFCGGAGIVSSKYSTDAELAVIPASQPSVTLYARMQTNEMLPVSTPLASCEFEDVALPVVRIQSLRVLCGSAVVRLTSSCFATGLWPACAARVRPEQHGSIHDRYF